MQRLLTAICVLVMSLAACGLALAHESQPGSLELRQLAGDRYEVTWRAPIYFGRPHPARLELPAHWREVVPVAETTLPDSHLLRRVVSIGDNGLEGSVIRFAGLEQTITDVFIRTYRLDGTSMTMVASPTKPYAQLRGERSWHVTAGEYIGLGFHHILSGFDHLLFVLGLLLIVNRWRLLIKTITAFTVAHSMTLALAALGFAEVPRPPLEAAIALSILFLGPEIVRTWRGETSLTIRYPWVVAFLFGLLHGFAFASGMSLAGMPKAEIPMALLFFNVGVEIGQLVFVSTALTLVWLSRRLRLSWPRWIEVLPGYLVGSLGAYWTIQRTVMMFGGLRF